MKRCLCRVTCLIVAAALLFGGCAAGGEPEEKAPHTTLVFTGTAGFTEVAARGDLRLFADPATAQFYCENTATGQILRSNPEGATDDPVANALFKMNLQSQLKIGFVNSALTYEDTYNYVGAVKSGNFTCRSIPDGVRFDFDFTYEGFVIPLEITLTDEGLRARVPVDEIVEYKDNLLTECVLLPYMGAVTADGGGDIVLPDGCGALLPVGNSGAGRYVGYVYGRDAAYSRSLVSQKADQTLTLPCYGITSPAGGFLATLGEGASLCRVTAVPAGIETSFANAFPTYTLRNTDTAVLQEMSGSARTVQVINKTPAAVSSLTVDWRMLTPEQTYADMAAMLRGELGLQAGGERRDVFLDLLLAVREKGTVLAIPVQKVTPYVTFDGAAAIGERLSAAGIEGLLVNLKGWQKGADFYKVPLLTKPESALGSKSAFDNLLKNEGVRYAAAVDYLDLYATGNGVNQKRDAVRDVSGGFCKQSDYRRSTFTRGQNEWYLAKPSTYAELLKQAAEKGVFLFDEKGGDTLPSDGHTSSLRGITPTDREAALAQYLDAYRAVNDKGGSLLFADPMGYALPYAAGAVSLADSASGFLGFSEEIPLLQMVCHGAFSYSGGALNLAADYEGSLLRAAEYGESVYFSLTEAPDGVLPARYTDAFSSSLEYWEPRLTEAAGYLRPMQEATAGKRMTAHEKVAEGIYRTTYEDGTAVTVNYTDAAYAEGTLSVPPRGYTVTK